jgi:hypothetical protein
MDYDAIIIGSEAGDAHYSKKASAKPGMENINIYGREV